ncbi:MAG: sugar transferase [Elusimicrobia bacterium]|nr:sugar transferase [Elusimicrobiota bacterium]
MKRFFDIATAILLLIALSLPMLLLVLLVKLTSRGSALYWSDRIGRNNDIFKMPKFRTMRVDTPPMATHLMIEPERFLTPLGGFLRKTSLDELPQLFSILWGDMSFVGPRPALFNQDDLITLRTVKGIYRITPGLTGWAQVNGRDDLAIPVKVEYDEYYLKHRSFAFDIKILFMTALQAITGKGVRH